MWITRSKPTKSSGYVNVRSIENCSILTQAKQRSMYSGANLLDSTPIHDNADQASSALPQPTVARQEASCSAHFQLKRALSPAWTKDQLISSRNSRHMGQIDTPAISLNPYLAEPRVCTETVVPHPRGFARSISGMPSLNLSMSCCIQNMYRRAEDDESTCIRRRWLLWMGHCIAPVQAWI
jgi:hypothetical protein